MGKNANHIERLARALYSHGLVEEAYTELQELSDGAPVDSTLERRAIFELARWHAFKSEPEDLNKALSFLERLDHHHLDLPDARKKTIMAADCLGRLGRDHEAREIITEALRESPHGDLWFALSNLEQSLEAKITAINKGLSTWCISPINLLESTCAPYDRLASQCSHVDCAALVSVIMPCFNAESTIDTAIRSILEQSWSSLELIIVDDCSTDRTYEIARAWERRDARVKVYQLERNSGPYVARNYGILKANGDFVTTNDADDWSHPQKISVQAQHLLENPLVLGNLSEQARASDKLQFRRWVNYGVITQHNASSFMFRRGAVIRRVGYLDSVRFGADNEYIRRIERAFGRQAVQKLKTGPLSFQRQGESSLVNSEHFGIRTHYRGARLEYLNSYKHYHQSARDLYMPFPMLVRPFPAPEPMLPDRSEPSVMDLVVAADFAAPARSLRLVLEEIKAHIKMGKRVGLVDLPDASRASDDFDPVIRDLIDGEHVSVLVYGQSVETPLLMIRDPDRFHSSPSRFLPAMNARYAAVVASLSPSRIGGEFCRRYDVASVAQVVENWCGVRPVWFPANEGVGKAFKRECHEGRISHTEVCYGWYEGAYQLGISDEQQVDQLLNKRPDWAETTCLDENVLWEQRENYKNRRSPELLRVVHELLVYADDALSRQAPSVVDKKSLPPSGCKQDYWHPHPYWWPNPESPDGLPYIRRDGQRAPGTRLYESESERYDRTRLQRLFDDGFVLSLACYFSGDDRYGRKAAESLSRFFLQPDTAMNPHLRFAQIRPGIDKFDGPSTGIIEFKDVYFYLDAVRLLWKLGHISDKQIDAFKSWLRKYLKWLKESKQGTEECRRSNNHGTYYDLQVAAIASFLGCRKDVLDVLTRAADRIGKQITSKGAQPEELRRTVSKHYCCFNLQAWINLSLLARKYDVNLMSQKGQSGGAISTAIQWLNEQIQGDWNYQQISEFDEQRVIPIFSLAGDYLPAFAGNMLETKQVFDPHDGIRPFWSIGAKPLRHGNAGKASSLWVHLESDRDALGMVKRIKDQTFSDGLFEDGLSAFGALVKEGSRFAKALAARELALHYTNCRTPEASKEAIRYLKATAALSEPADLRSRAILEAENRFRLGDVEGGESALRAVPRAFIDTDILLARATRENLLAEERVGILNYILSQHSLEPLSLSSRSGLPFDCLAAEPPALGVVPHNDLCGPVVTVIVPAYNSEQTIVTALRSISAQSFGQFEVVVVDDCSTDATARLVEEYASRDPRIRLIKASENGGPYRARNIALRTARGRYVTCHDADDWSHPRKLETQVEALENNQALVATMSRQVRLAEDLTPYRRGNYGYYMFENMSSLMFRRLNVLSSVGYWDSVRFAADNEFLHRLKRVFGRESVAIVGDGPLSFQRQRSGSLTANSSFGYHGYFFGARKVYRDAHVAYHKAVDASRDLYCHYQERMPFFAPHPMRVTRVERETTGIILVGDEGSPWWGEEDFLRLKERVEDPIEFVSWKEFSLTAVRPAHERFLKALREGSIIQRVYGETVNAELLLLLPRSRWGVSKWIPRILAKELVYLGAEEDIDKIPTSLVENVPPVAGKGAVADLIEFVSRQAKRKVSGEKF